MTNNPQCPHCGAKTRKAGTHESGSQRYRCYVCGKTHTDSANPSHRPVTGKALSNAERQARYRAKKAKPQIGQ